MPEWIKEIEAVWRASADVFSFANNWLDAQEMIEEEVRGQDE